MVLGGHVWVPIIHFSLGINAYLTLLALKSIQGTEAVPLGQVLVISGLHEVQGGRGWAQNNLYSSGINSYLTLLATINPRARRWP